MIDDLTLRKILNEYNNYLAEELRTSLIIELNSIVSKYADSVIKYSNDLELENKKLKEILNEINNSFVGYLLFKRAVKKIGNKEKTKNDKKQQNPVRLKEIIEEFNYE